MRANSPGSVARADSSAMACRDIGGVQRRRVAALAGRCEQGSASQRQKDQHVRRGRGGATLGAGRRHRGATLRGGRRRAGAGPRAPLARRPLDLQRPPLPRVPFDRRHGHRGRPAHRGAQPRDRQRDRARGREQRGGRGGAAGEVRASGGAGGARRRGGAAPRHPLAALADALAAGAKAARQLTDLEAAYSCMRRDDAARARARGDRSVGEARGGAGAPLTQQCRKDSRKPSTPQKAGAAALRGEKARKQLLASGAGAPPIEDELNVLEAARALREAHALTAAREAEAADDVLRREETATAQVAAAVAALEQMSETSTPPSRRPPRAGRRSEECRKRRHRHRRLRLYLRVRRERQHRHARRQATLAPAHSVGGSVRGRRHGGRVGGGVGGGGGGGRCGATRSSGCSARAVVSTPTAVAAAPAAAEAARRAKRRRRRRVPRPMHPPSSRRTAPLAPAPAAATPASAASAPRRLSSLFKHPRGFARAHGVVVAAPLRSAHALLAGGLSTFRRCRPGATPPPPPPPLRSLPPATCRPATTRPPRRPTRLLR